MTVAAPTTTEPTPEAGDSVRPPGSASGIGSFLVLFALTGILITQPLLDVFAGAPEIFVARRAGTLDIVAFAVVIALVPAAALWLVERAVGLAGPPARRWAHLGIVAVLGLLFVVQAGKRATEVPGRFLILAGIVVGVALARAVARSEIARTFLHYLAVAPLAFVGLFLFASPVGRVMSTDGTVTPAGVVVDRPAPVVMIVLDELGTGSLLDGDGAIDADLYPNIAQLAGDGTWYRNHTTVAAYTAEAVPAILTGKMPKGTAVPATPSEHPDNLFTLLGGSDESAVIETITHLCPQNLCPDEGGVERRAVLPSLLTQAAGTWAELTSPRRAEEEGATYEGVDPDTEADTADRRFDQLVESFDQMSGESLHFLHALLPHQPWNWLPSGQRYDAGQEGYYGAWVSPSAGQAARQRHLLQTQFADRMVGRVMDRLRELDRYDDALIVLTADHGVSFSHRSSVRAVSSENASDVLWVPLIIKSPGQQSGEVSDAPTQSTDIVPTIADILSIELPWETHGVPVSDVPDRNDVEFFDRPKDREIRGAALDVDREGELAEVLRSSAVEPGAPAELRPYRTGPHPELVGVAVSEVDAGRTSDRNAGLDVAALFADVDPDADEVPVYVSGELDGDDSVTVAVAVNGVVGGAFTTVGAGEGRQRFWTIVPPDLLVEGANDIELFVVEGPGRFLAVPLE
jgi:hypothetical protein